MATHTKARDSQGKALDAERLYEPISPHGRTVNRAPRIFNVGAKLRGDHEAVVIAPRLWISADATDEEKSAARRAHYTAAVTDLPQTEPDPWATKIAEQRRIPFERRVMAVDAFWKGDTYVAKGPQRDVDDPIVRAAPQMFRDLDGRLVSATRPKQAGPQLAGEIRIATDPPA
jgi:hypothetical protein